MILRTSIVVPIALGAAIHAILWWISEPDMLFSDFHKAYFPAARLLWELGPKQAWPLPEPGIGGFVNVPIMAWLFVPLLPLGPELASWVFLVLGVVAVAGAWHVCCVLGQLSDTSRAWLAVAFLVNGPLVNSLKEGNSTHFVLLLLAVGLLFLVRARDEAAGLMLGAAMLVKLPILLMLAYLASAQRWRAITAAVGLILATLALSCAVHGFTINRSWYLDSIAPYLGRAIAAFNAQSIDGFLARLETGSTHLLDWTPLVPSLPHKVARTLLAVTVVLAGSGLIIARRRRQSKLRQPLGGAGIVCEFSLVLIIALIISPLSWTHYYLLLLLPCSVLANRDQWIGCPPALRATMAAGMALASLPVVILDLNGQWLEIYSRTFQSIWLFGGIVMLIALMFRLARDLKPASQNRAGA